MRNQPIGNIIVDAVEDTVAIEQLKMMEMNFWNHFVAQHANNTIDEDSVSPNPTILSDYCHHYLLNFHLGVINSHQPLDFLLL